MTLKEFQLTEDNHFVAMEYYNLIWNRTFLILLTSEFLVGLPGNGVVSVDGGNNLLVSQINSSLAIRGDLQNPQSYLKEKYIRKIENRNWFDPTFLGRNRPAFILNRKEIKNAWYDKRKK